MSSVDVVVPCYRYGHFLRECVGSVLNQADVDVRVLIIDDASPDDTAEVGLELEREDRRITFVRHSANKGHIATYNEGIDWLSSEYYLLLSADDYLLPGALRRASNLMNCHPETGFVFGNGIALHDDGTEKQIYIKISSRHSPVMSGQEFLSISGAQNIVITPTAVVRTQLQKGIGGYSTKLPHTADMENWMRLAAHASVGFVDSHQAVYRRHKENMSIAFRSAGGLPDLQQRRDALASFFDTYEEMLPTGGKLRAELFRRLAQDALHSASQALNLGDTDGSQSLADFAYSISPELRKSLQARKLWAKKCLGQRLWTVVRNPAQAVRRSFL